MEVIAEWRMKSTFVTLQPQARQSEEKNAELIRFYLTCTRNQCTIYIWQIFITLYYPKKQKGICGTREARKIKGYHDEPLKGGRKGQRSIRLNKAYRAIYVEKNGEIDFIEIQEVNKHEY